MKLTAIILLSCCLSVSAATRAQNITLSEQNVSLEKVFKEVERQSGYVFFFDNSWLDKARPVTLQVRDVPLSSVLDLCFTNQPLTYSIVGRNIVVRLKENGTIIKNETAAAPADTLILVAGRVVDSAYMPLAGASVIVSGKNKGGMQTDANGNFSFRTNSLHPVLIISYLGFTTREIKWPEGIKTVTVQLHSSSDPLDAVQVIAYGTNTRRFSVGAISTVTSDDIEKQPVQNVLLALEGLVPGLAVNPSNGAPGAAVQLQIRGQNTLKGASPLPGGAAPPIPFDQPLFIIDGVPMATQNNSVNQLSSILNNPTPPYGGGLSPFNGISPQDIASISILKDADATSIYGSQGANGVVLITTKKGKPGKTQVNISVNSGPNKVTKHTEMMNTTQYLAMRREAIQNDGLVADPNDPSAYPDLFIFDTTRNHNWYDEFFGGTANTTDMHLQVSGGSNTTTFLLSGGYSRQVFNTQGGFAADGLFYHSGFHYNSVDHRLNIDITNDLSYTTNDNSGSPSPAAGYMLPPDLPALKDAKGNLIWTYKGVDIADFQQYAFTLQKYDATSLMLNNSMTIAYRVLPGLNIRALAGYSDNRTAETRTNPLSSQDPGGFAQNSAQFGNNGAQTIDVEPQLDYELTRGKHSLSATFGGQYKAATSSTDQLEGYGYSTDALLNSVAGATYLYGNNTSEIYKYGAGFGRIRYIYDQKYILSLTGRRDGSSKFGPGRQFGNFGSVGAGWIVSEEKFFKQALPFISYTKLAGNYGTTGNDGVAAYQYLSLWQPIQNTPDFEGLAGYKPLNLYNPDYSWETKHSTNISLDLGFLHDRVLLNATYYLSRCGNQLTGALLPAQTGFSSVLENFPADVQNSGLELTVGTRNIVSKNFSWSSSFVISGNRNKLISFPNLKNSPYASTYSLGDPVTALHGYKFARINDTTGLYQFYNAQGKIPSDLNTLNGLPVSEGGDIQTIGDLTPRYYGSLGNTFSYKGLSLSLTFMFSRGKGRTYLQSLYGNEIYPGGETNMPVAVEDRWRKPGDHAQIQRISTGYSGANFAASDFAESDGTIGDASYIRLKNVALSYSLPPSFLKQIGLKGFSLYLRGENLLTITGYKVGDPEMQNLLNFPFQRTVAGGVSINL